MKFDGRVRQHEIYTTSTRNKSRGLYEISNRLRTTRFLRSTVRFEGQFGITGFGLGIIELSTRCIPDPELSSFIISGIADTRIVGDCGG